MSVLSASMILRREGVGGGRSKSIGGQIDQQYDIAKYVSARSPCRGFFFFRRSSASLQVAFSLLHQDGFDESSMSPELCNSANPFSGCVYNCALLYA